MIEQRRGRRDGAAQPAADTGSDHVVAAHPNEAGNGRVEVVVVAGAGAPRLELRLLAWGRSVGWYPLRRIALDAQQAQALRRSLLRAERYLGARDAGPEGSGCRIIPFPAPPAAEGDET